MREPIGKACFRIIIDRRRFPERRTRITPYGARGRQAIPRVHHPLDVVRIDTALRTTRRCILRNTRADLVIEWKCRARVSGRVVAHKEGKLLTKNERSKNIACKLVFPRQHQVRVDDVVCPPILVYLARAGGCRSGGTVEEPAEITLVVSVPANVPRQSHPFVKVVVESRAVDEASELCCVLVELHGPERIVV